MTSIFLTVLFFFSNWKLVEVRCEEICNQTRNESTKYSYFENRLVQDDGIWSFFTNFKEFNNLLLDCNQTYDISQYVVMWPKYHLIIDESFQVRKILKQSQLESIAFLSIGNLKGIDLNSKPFIQDFNFRIREIEINLFMSKFILVPHNVFYDLFLFINYIKSHN